MIEVSLAADKLREMSDNARTKWGFQRNGNQLTAAMNEHEFEDFLRANNLIVYKNDIKRYQNGQMLGEFRSVSRH